MPHGVQHTYEVLARRRSDCIAAPADLALFSGAIGAGRTQQGPTNVPSINSRSASSRHMPGASGVPYPAPASCASACPVWRLGPIWRSAYKADCKTLRCLGRVLDRRVLSKYGN